MFPKMNPKQMRKMMKQMGMEVEELQAQEVVIRLEDREIFLKGPSVNIIEMQGQKSYQISGGVESEASQSELTISSEDVDLVASQAGVSKEEAKQALEDSEGDIAAAIMSLGS